MSIILEYHKIKNLHHYKSSKIHSSEYFLPNIKRLNIKWFHIIIRNEKLCALSLLKYIRKLAVTFTIKNNIYNLLIISLID